MTSQTLTIIPYNIQDVVSRKPVYHGRNADAQDKILFCTTCQNSVGRAEIESVPQSAFEQCAHGTGVH